MKKFNINLFLICTILICFAIWGCNSSSSSRPPTHAERPLAPRASKNPVLSHKPGQATTEQTDSREQPLSKRKAKSIQKKSVSQANANELPTSETTHQTPNKTYPKIPVQTDARCNPNLYAAIERWYGTPHQRGGCSLQGVDCSCFVSHLYQDVYNIRLSRSSNDMLKDIEPILRTDLKEGDLVFFKVKSRMVNHVGLYLKDDFFAHSSTSQGVTVSSLNDKYWTTYYYASGRHKAVKTLH